MRALQCCITAFQTRLKIKILKKKEQYKALVIDCGGGTTDLTSCIYDIEDNKITYQLDLKTVYANGDIHFGGNNITYRIMQYLKILFSAYYQKQKVPFIGELFHTSSTEIYKYIDEFGKIHYMKN